MEQRLFLTHLQQLPPSGENLVMWQGEVEHVTFATLKIKSWF
jgi:hypothetical protein